MKTFRANWKSPGRSAPVPGRSSVNISNALETSAPAAFPTLRRPGTGALQGAVALALLLAVANATALTNTMSANAVAPVAKTLPAQTILTPTAPVASPASPAGEDIRDIRQPRHLPTPWFWVVVAAGVISLAAALWKWIRRRKLFVMLPHEVALQHFEESRALMNPDRAREYCFEVSKIIRRYIEERFHVHAPQLTTEEFLHELMAARETMPAPQRALLGDFLQHCDLAKFAGWRYCLPDLQAMHTSAVEFVRQTAVTDTKPGKNKTPATQTTANNNAPAPELERAETI